MADEKKPKTDMKAEPKAKPTMKKVSNVLKTDASSEKEMTKEKSAKPKDAKSKKHVTHTHIEHHYDDEGKSAGHTVRHKHDAGEVSYAAADMDAIHDGLEQHVGDPNADEGAEPQAQPQQAEEPPQAGAPQQQPGM